MMPKYVYFFGNGKADGNAQMKNLLGGKGANLAEMTSLGIPVPSGFTISTDICGIFYKSGGEYPPELKGQVEEALHEVERLMECRFGDPEKPLLVSVRSGAASSMPGMMDTILNLGLNDDTVQGLAKQMNDERFAYDCYRRFIAMYGDVVMGLKPESKDDMDPFDQILEKMKKRRGIEFDSEMPAVDLKELVVRYKGLIMAHSGSMFPQDPFEQLWGAITAVFNSWNNPRAIAYRELNEIPEDMGTAVNVQSMVYGNMGEDCGTGVAFTRNPATGDNVFYGEYLMNAQGEDVVAGIRTPEPINRAQKIDSSTSSLEEDMPDIYKELERVRAILDRHYRGHAGYRVHDPEGQALDAPDAVRQADGNRVFQDRRGHGPGRHSQQGGSPHARGPGAVEPTPAAHVQPQGEAGGDPSRRPAGQGIECGTGCRDGAGGFQRTRCGGMGAAGRKGHPGPDRNLSGGHTRHARGAGDSHRARGYDFPRGPGRAPRWARCAWSAATRWRSNTASTGCPLGGGSSRKATGFPWTAPRGKCSKARFPRVLRTSFAWRSKKAWPRKIPRYTRTTSLCWNGRMNIGGSVCGPMRTRRTRRPWRSHSGRKESGSRAPSICSLKETGSTPSGR